MRILVVDDDYVSRTKLKALFGKYGDVDVAPTGMIALEMFEIAQKEATPYGLISLDIDMPVVRGPQVVETIRSYETENKVSCSTKIVMIAGKKSPKELIESSKLGAERFLVKPVTPIMIHDTLSQLGLTT